MRIGRGCCRSGNLPLWVPRRPVPGRFDALSESRCRLRGRTGIWDFGSDGMAGLVITGGRVVDPASGMDAVGDVAILDGRIAAVGSGLGGAERTIDATGLVVAPGFIDLHAHGQSIPADRMQAFDGVTTTLDLEAGVLPVASWYRRQAAKGRVLNYGASTNWAFARIGAMTGSNEESSLEAFGVAMRDRRWVDDVG